MSENLGQDDPDTERAREIDEGMDAPTVHSTIDSSPKRIPDGPAANDQATTSFVANDATIQIAPKAGEQPTIAGSHEAKAASGSSPAEVFRRFGDYEILREIARGGMGVIFLARQVSLNRPVALKMILAGQLADETDVKRFHTEAESAANLDHPGIVPIFEVGQHDGQHFFSMAFIEGNSLAQRLADGPLPAREAADLIRQVSAAIEYAHSRGVIHRDLKPANILLERSGKPRVTDFGLAKKLEADSGLTGSGQIMGTPSYMPPEQANGRPADVGPAADVYALGATLYALITGRPPFQAATAMDTMLLVVNDEPVPPRRLNPSIPRDLETICLTCLRKEPSKRYASAALLSDDLTRFLSGESINARPSSRLEKSVKWARRRPAIAGLSMATLLATAVGIAGIAWQWHTANVQREIAEKNAKIAKLNEEKAEESARLATEKAEALRRRDYVSRVNLAYQECLDNNVSRAIELLDGCPADLRGWEWQYVNRQCHLDLRTFREPAPAVLAVAFTPDGRRMASGTGSFVGSGAGDLVVRDLETGNEVFAARNLAGGVHAVAFSPDGHELAVGYGQTLAFHDSASGQERFHRTTGPNTIDSLAFSPDGKRIVTGAGGSPGYAKVWDVATGTAIGDPIPGYGGNIASVSVSPDGQQVAVGSAGRIDIWKLDTHESVRVLKTSDSIVYAVAFSPDGRFIAAGGLDRIVRLWDRATGVEIRQFVGHEGFVRGLAFSSDGKYLATCAEDKSIRLWSVDSDRELRAFHGHSHYVLGVAFSPDSHRIVSGSLDQTIKLWFATPSPQFTMRDHTGWVTSVAFSPDGRQVASGAGNYNSVNALKNWDPVTGEEIRSFPIGVVAIDALTYSKDGRSLATSLWGGFVLIWDVAKGNVRLVLRGGTQGAYEPANIAFSPDGRLIALGDDDGSVKIWDALSGRPVQTLKGFTSHANGVAFSPDGKRLAAGSEDTTIRIWDTPTWKETHLLKGHTLRVASVAFSPDGRLVASVGGVSVRGGEAKLWDVETSELIHDLRGHTDTVSGVAFSPDGRRLATASDDRTIKLWDPSTGNDVFSLRGHTGGVLCVAFSPDGERIASGGIDRTAKVWDTSLPSAQQLLQRLAVPLVAGLSQTLLLKEDLIERIKKEPALDQPLRAAALEVADRLRDNPLRLNDTSWMIVREPNRSPADYDLARRYVETACKLEPKQSMYTNTLGVARYRVGRYLDALGDLTRSLPLNAAQYGGPIPADLAFIAMSQYRLDRKQEARSTLGQLREVMRNQRWANDDESASFLDEANELIEGIKPPVTEVGRFAIDEPEAVAFSPDGKTVIACSTDGTTRLWDAKANKPIGGFEERGAGRQLNLAFSRDAKRVLSGGQDKIVRLWEVATGKPIRELAGHTECIFNVAFSPDGRVGYSTSGGPDPWNDGQDAAVRVWDLDKGTPLYQLEGHKGRVLGLAVSPDGSRLLSGGHDTMILWDLKERKEIHRFPGHTGQITQVAFLPDGRRAVSSSLDRSIRLWDLETKQELHVFLGHTVEVTWLAVSPDGRKLLSSDYNGHDLRLWDVDGRTLIRRIGYHGASPTRGAFSPDGRQAVWGGNDDVVRLYELRIPDQEARAQSTAEATTKREKPATTGGGVEPSPKK
jgi:WD40 repeat protein